MNQDTKKRVEEVLNEVRECHGRPEDPEQLIYDLSKVIFELLTDHDVMRAQLKATEEKITVLNLDLMQISELSLCEEINMNNVNMLAVERLDSAMCEIWDIAKDYGQKQVLTT